MHLAVLLRLHMGSRPLDPLSTPLLHVALRAHIGRVSCAAACMPARVTKRITAHSKLVLVTLPHVSQLLAMLLHSTKRIMGPINGFFPCSLLSTNLLLIIPADKLNVHTWNGGKTTYRTVISAGALWKDDRWATMPYCNSFIQCSAAWAWLRAEMQAG